MRHRVPRCWRLGARCATGRSCGSSLRDGFRASYDELAARARSRRGGRGRPATRSDPSGSRSPVASDVDPRAFLTGSSRPRARPTRSCTCASCRPARPMLEPFPDDLPELLVARLGLTGVHGLYPHQADGLDGAPRRARRRHGHRHRERQDARVQRGVRRGRDRPRRRPPRSTCSRRRRSRATSSGRCAALKLPQVKAAVYDGDTPRAERPLIRTNANLVMTNPDMLHLSLLPDHARWADFFLRLSLVVVDEAHVCRGVFGSHVAMVLRRLRRLDRALRRRPAVVPGHRDRRQPGRARRRGSRASTFDAGHRRRLALRREAVRAVEPADHRRGDRRPAQRAVRGARG